MADATADIQITSLPSLAIQVAYFHPDDLCRATKLALGLYDALTRPRKDRLGFGLGIPVFGPVAAESVDADAAKTILVVPVVGEQAYYKHRASVVSAMVHWRQEFGRDNVLLLPTSSRWPVSLADAAENRLRRHVSRQVEWRESAIVEIVLRATKLLPLSPEEQRELKKTNGKPKLYISHAIEGQNTAGAAYTIFKYISDRIPLHEFFDEIILLAGEPLAEKRPELEAGVFIAVRGDTYGSRSWCQHELLKAKELHLPTLVVEVLQRGERRSSPYAGNVPTLVWKQDPAIVALQAMIEWLRARHFKHEADRVIKDAKLPTDTRKLTRPPEVLDLIQGPLSTGEPQLIMHPDPELSLHEQTVLRKANSRLRLATPTTTFRRVLTKKFTAAELPLAGIQVSMALSDGTDGDGPKGYTKHHLQDAVTQIARTLVSSGVAIAYGGDLRQKGFTHHLAELIDAYNQTALAPAELLHHYVSAVIQYEHEPQWQMHYLDREPYRARTLLTPPTEGGTHHRSLYFSDMRQVMAQCVQAAVVLGGQTTPKLLDGKPGYGGRFPGVVEEAWRMLAEWKPLYIVGGFGGAAAMVADLLIGRPTPDRLKSVTWMHSERFRRTMGTLDADTGSRELRLPARMDDLADEIRRFGAIVLQSDATSERWNGLTLAENRRLFDTRDLVTVVSLVIKGLLRTRQKKARALEIELVHGSITDATELDAVAVATFENVPLGGAGAAIDRAVGHLAAVKRTQGQTLISIKDTKLDADWLYLASLGMPNTEKLVFAVEEAARGTAETVNRHGLERIGLVAFGGVTTAKLDPIVEAMLRGLRTSERASYVWFESDKTRFDDIHNILKKPEVNVQLSTRILPQAEAPPSVSTPSLILHITCENDQLTTSILPPVVNAAVPLVKGILDKATENSLSYGAGVNGWDNPGLTELKTRGDKLGALLFRGQIDPFLAEHSEARIVVVHDERSAGLPFESLRLKSDAYAVQRNFHRILIAQGVSVDYQLGRPTKREKLKVLLIIDPTRDLAAARKEGEILKGFFNLDENKKKFDVQPLENSQVTIDAVRDLLPSADIVHYCGHAFFEKADDGNSGLNFRNGTVLKASDLNEKGVPRIVIMNACQSGQVVAGRDPYKAASLAAFFLRGGVEAFVGTLWTVFDRAAGCFSKTLYERLFAGYTLEESVRAAREALQKADEPDWANYVLYGDGRFKLSEGEGNADA
jgi:hypothetical protein